jgi:hypothetical protein
VGNWSTIIPVISTPAAFAEYPPRKLNPERWTWILPMSGEDISEIAIVDQIWTEQHGPQLSDNPIWWKPTVEKIKWFPSSQIPVERDDMPYSLTLGDRRLLWWEDVKTETILRYGGSSNLKKWNCPLITPFR